MNERRSKKERTARITPDEAYSATRSIPIEIQPAEIPEEGSVTVGQNLANTSLLGSDCSLVIGIVAELTKKIGVPGSFPNCDKSLSSISRKDVALMSSGMMYLLK